MKSPNAIHYCGSLLTLTLLFTWSSCNNSGEPTTTHDYTSLIPEISINTNGRTIINEPKITAGISIKENGAESFTGHIGIEFRGSTSYRLFEKKSFSIETQDAAGADMNVSIFDFPAEEDWVLNGPYSDKTLLRNVLSFELSNQIGMYAPRTKLVELKINNEYLGVYVFMEKLKRNKERIAISKLTSADVDPTKISGGYILKIDKTAGDSDNDDWSGDAEYMSTNSFRSNFDQSGTMLSTTPFGAKTSAETYFLYEYPDAAEINVEQQTYIKKYMNDFETALANEDFSTGTRLYENYIDVNSFVDFFIMSELSHNADAYRLSTYLYKDKDSKLKMGPLWDLNLTYGNDGDSFRNSPTTWIYQYNSFIPNDLWLVPFWWQKLMQDPLFKSKVKTRWAALRSSTLSKSNIISIIDKNVSILTESKAIERNFDRWKIMGVAVAFNGFVGQTYTEEITFVKSWIELRLAWMDSEIAGF